MTIDIGIDRKGHSIRMLVYQALEQYPTRSLFPFLHDRSAIVRTAAARRLQTRGGREVLDYGLQLTVSKVRSDREIGAFLLGQLGTPNQPYGVESIPSLITLCADTAAEVRVAAIAALGHLRAKKAISAIQRATRDPVLMVQEMAKSVLRQLTR